MRLISVIVSICTLSMCVMSAQQPPSTSQSAKGDDMPCGMIYGKDHFLSVCSPKGWTFDDSVMANKGIYATFYRTPLTFQEAMARHTIMYVNVVIKEEGQQSAAELMKLDAEKTKHDSPKVRIEIRKPITIPADKKTPEIEAPVQAFLNGYQGGYESVAYIENDKTIVLIVITSASRKLLEQDYPDFVKLVQSYKFMGSNVKIDNQ